MILLSLPLGKVFIEIFINSADHELPKITEKKQEG
jgi:hypothetical protein